MGKFEIITKYDLREDVFAINRGRIYKGVICKVTVNKHCPAADWNIYYDVKVAANHSIWNIPERLVFKDRQEAYNKLHNL